MYELSCNYEDLKWNEACVEFENEDQSDAWLYALSSDCVSCPYTRVSSISSANTSSIKFNVARSMTWLVLDNDFQEYVSSFNNSNAICTLFPNLGEYGSYSLKIRNGTCFLNTVNAPSSPYTALLIVLGALMCFLIGVSWARMLWNLIETNFMKKGESRTFNESTKKRRIKSIDTFRGISILLMIFVNDGAGKYHIMEHATWNGLLIGDLVFPCFIWIMGVCIPIALSAQLSRGISKLRMSLNIVKRSIFLFVIGVSLGTLGTTSQLEEIRIFGVLQRFSIAYFVVALLSLVLFTGKSKRTTSKFQDMWILLPHWCVMMILVITHTSLTFKLPVPGCPTGYVGPGGLHENGKYWNCTGGAAGYIDRLILTSHHIYKNLTIVDVYKSPAFDPEGILGCLTTIFQVFLGVQAGQILLCYKDWRDRVVRWLLWAAFLGILGFVAHVYFIPVNKNLWSLSFVLVTTAFALALLSGCYLLVDVVRIWRGGPFRIPGMNALVMYVGHLLCYQIFPFNWRIGNMHSRMLTLIESIWAVVLWTLVAYIMHRKRTYISL